ncbi:adenosylcobinamide-GDP ribazoletransferase [Paenibacillus bovis]|uniref:Adenosylcobinamide-GDP ribazoletransferase n=1 Tax=Paenibacillus bovis TaxID=1616788 RepID=A0A172ZEM4_9BACL|nr:adenosylcobinamide-GDP ribazoletransferase [Paenibacillus bovis]ANF96078.1 adenosylcobinamide-GDP ribazoletransferase [Paenibacillus bovis]
MNREIEAMAAAFQFLSRIPVRLELDFGNELLRRSVKYYPLIGWVIGICTAAGAVLFQWLLPTAPAAVLTLCLWIGLTGALHLDGWMDSADGLLSHRSREQMLEIMKDSRVGAMGVIACILLLGLKGSLLYALLAAGDHSKYAVYIVMILPMIWSRWYMVKAIASWPTARQEGLAALFSGTGRTERNSAGWIALGCTAAIALILWIVFQQPGEWTIDNHLAGDAARRHLILTASLLCCLLSPICAWLVGEGIARRAASRLGGLTGDIYGALNEGVELCILLLITMIWYQFGLLG